MVDEKRGVIFLRPLQGEEAALVDNINDEDLRSDEGVENIWAPLDNACKAFVQTENIGNFEKGLSVEGGDGQCTTDRSRKTQSSAGTTDIGAAHVGATAALSRCWALASPRSQAVARRTASMATAQSGIRTHGRATPIPGLIRRIGAPHVLEDEFADGKSDAVRGSEDESCFRVMAEDLWRKAWRAQRTQRKRRRSGTP